MSLVVCRVLVILFHVKQFNEVIQPIEGWPGELVPGRGLRVYFNCWHIKRLDAMLPRASGTQRESLTKLECSL